MNRKTVRVKTRWTEVSLYVAVALSPSWLAYSCSAQGAAPRFAIEARQITDAMRASALPVDGAQVNLSAPVTSLTPSAELEVVSVAPVGAHTLRLRLACSDHSACLPFLATVTMADSVDVKMVAASQTAAKDQAELKGAALQVNKQAGSGKGIASLRAGASATLAFDADKIHVRIAVISLQNAAPGDHVRVSSLDHKQIYTAEVITPSVLKGELAR